MSAIDVLSRLTPQMTAVLAKQNDLAGDAFATDVGFVELRQNYAKERVFWNEGGPVMAESVDGVVPGPAGDVAIRTHHPVGADGRSCIIYIHGGGFVVGDLDTHDRIMRALAENAGAVVVGVDYSLSPEAKFPQAIQECAAVAQYVRDNADALGVDADRIAFAGDSGGASLSLATALYLRDKVENAPNIACLILYYGMFGLRDSMSRRLYGGEWDGLTKADLDYYSECYTSNHADVESPYIDCLAADLTRDLPPCYIAAAGLDPLLDDSAALAAVLEENHIEHRFTVYDGVLHAFLHHSRMLPEAVAVLADGAEFFTSQNNPERSHNGLQPRR
jgi:acetyl esterase